MNSRRLQLAALCVLLAACGSAGATTKAADTLPSLPDCDQFATKTSFADLGLTGTFHDTGNRTYDLDIKNTSAVPVLLGRSQLVNMFAVASNGKLESRHLDYAVGSPDLPLAPGDTFVQHAVIDPYDCKNMKLPAGTYHFALEVLLADAKSAISPTITVTLP
jgi:hypothetical protein